MGPTTLLIIDPQNDFHPGGSLVLVPPLSEHYASKQKIV